MKQLTKVEKSTKPVFKKSAGIFEKRKDASFFSVPNVVIAARHSIHENEAELISNKIMNSPHVNIPSITPSQVLPVDRVISEKNQKMQPSSAHFWEVINSAGEEIDPMTRCFMETRFKTNFGKIRIHNNSKAHDSAARVSANAYTYGNHIAFNRNRYKPGTKNGRKLLAHELVHSLQQAKGNKLIQREPENSILDADQAIEDFGKAPDIESIIDIHKKANPVLKDITDRIMRVYDDPLGNGKSEVLLWSYLEKWANDEPEGKSTEVNPKLDLFFDLYKRLNKNAEAKALSDLKKYIPSKTAFYSAAFYKAVLQGDMTWLPKHAAIKDIFPEKFRGTYSTYFWGPDMAVQDLAGIEKLKDRSAKLIEQLKSRKGLEDNEQLYVAINALIQASKIRYNKLNELNYAQGKTNLINIQKKIAVASYYKEETFWEDTFLPDIQYQEVYTLFKNVKPQIKKTATDSFKFWESIRTIPELMFKNDLVLRSYQTMFIQHWKIFKDIYQPKVIKAATIYLQLPGGKLPSFERLGSQKKQAKAEIDKITLKLTIDFSDARAKKLKDEDVMLPELYAYFIYVLELLGYAMTQKYTREEYRNSAIIERISIGRILRNFGVTTMLPDIKKLGDIVIDPIGDGKERKIGSDVQTESFFVFGPSLEWKKNDLPPLELFKKFNSQTENVQGSAMLATLMKLFFYYSLMQEETQILKDELKKFDEDLMAEEYPIDYKPMPKRVDEALQKRMTGEKSLVPELYTLNGVYFSISNQNSADFIDIILNTDDKLFDKLFSDLFGDAIHLFPVNPSTHVNAQGIVVWIVRRDAMNKFAEKLSEALRKRNILLPAVYDKSWLENASGTLIAASKTVSDPKLIQDDIFYNWITLQEYELFHLRRRSLSHHRRILLKYILMPLFDNYGETTSDIRNWGNPLKAVDVIINIAGGHPWTFKKIEGVDEQSELKLQIATALLELADIMYEKLFYREIMGGIMHAKTKRIDIASVLIPHVRGAVSMENQVTLLRNDLYPFYDEGDHQRRVQKLKELDAELLAVLRNYYESEVTKLSENEKQVIEKITGIDAKYLPTKTYYGDWLKGTRKKNDKEKGMLEDMTSNHPMRAGAAIMNEGKTYMLLEVFEDFYYRPAVKIDTGGVNWAKDLMTDINPSKLILVRNGVEEEIGIHDSRRKTIPLFSYAIYDPGKAAGDMQGDKAFAPNEDNSFNQVIGTTDMLNQFRIIIAVESNMKNLLILKEVLETGAEWLTVPFYFIPGLGEVVLAGEIVLGVIQFVNSEEFSFLMGLINGDGKSTLEEGFHKAMNIFDPSKIWDTVLDPSVGLPPIEEPAPKSTDAGAVQKSDGRLKKILLALARVGIKIWNGLVRVKDFINYGVKSIRAFLMNRPTLAAILAFIVDNFDLLTNIISDITDPDEEDKEYIPFVSEIQNILDQLRNLEVPKDIIPLDAIIDLIVRFALKMLKGPKGIIARGVRDLLDKAGIYDKILHAVSDRIAATWINPNRILNSLIEEHLRPLVNTAGQYLADGINDVLARIPLFNSITKPKANEVKEFAGTEYDYEDEIETQPFSKGNFNIRQHSPIPSIQSAGQPLEQRHKYSLTKQYQQDFSHVRIHHDAEAENATSSVDAEALASGSHVYLSSNINLNHEEGMQVLKHELAHVIQQTGSRPVTENYNETPVNGKPGKGIVFDPLKEEEADMFAENKQIDHLSSHDNSGEEGVFPKLTTVALKFFNVVSKEEGMLVKDSILNASMHARLTQSENTMAQSIPGKMKSIISTMGFNEKMKGGETETREYLKTQLDSIPSGEFINVVRRSKVKKKLGKSDDDVTNWQLKESRLKIALEELIAIQIGLMLDVEMEAADGNLTIKKIKATNIFLEKLRTNTNLWKKIMSNTFPMGLLPAAGQSNVRVTDDSVIFAKAKEVVKGLEIYNVLASNGFKFSANVAKQIQKQVYPDLTKLRTGEINNPIPIYWYKKTREDYIQKITLRKIKTGKKEFTMDSPPTQINYNTSDSIMLGLDPNNLVKAINGESNISSGTVLMRGTQEARTTAETRKFRDALQFNGYNMNDEDVDHVKDLGFGGTNKFSNFWPLKSKINRIPFTNRWYERYTIEYRDPVGSARLLSSIKKLSGKYFAIKGYKHEPERPGGKWIAD